MQRLDLEASREATVELFLQSSLQLPDLRVDGGDLCP
jgi:hypothetical protein